MQLKMNTSSSPSPSSGHIHIAFQQKRTFLQSHKSIKNDVRKSKSIRVVYILIDTRKRMQNGWPRCCVMLYIKGFSFKKEAKKCEQ